MKHFFTGVATFTKKPPHSGRAKVQPEPKLGSTPPLGPLRAAPKPAISYANSWYSDQQGSMDAPSKSVPVKPSPGREAWAQRRRAMEGRREGHSPNGRKKRRDRRLLGLAIKVFGLSLRPLGLYARGVFNAQTLKLTELELAIDSLPKQFDGYRILQFSDLHVDLSGHTHGGQVCLPGGRPIVTRMRGYRKYASGLWRCGEMIGYTSTGTLCSRTKIQGPWPGS